MIPNTVVLVCLLLIISARADFALAVEGGSLGGYPVCEASTVEVIDCKGDRASCLLVGDNEVGEALYRYDLPKPGKPIGKKTKLKFDKLIPNENNKLSDIEAMAVMPDGEIIVFGSHSRNKRCKKKNKRRWFVSFKIAGDKLKANSTLAVFTKEKHTCDRLFGNDRSSIEAQVAGICEVISRTELNAKIARAKPVPGCEADPAFNLEGAVAVPESGSQPRVWVGLRAPLVRGMALLLRLTEKRKKFRFSAAALIDLRGYGIRALTISDDKRTVWGIGGPPADSDRQHTLWRFPAADIKPGAIIRPRQVRNLATSSEGLAVAGTRAFVVYDGAQASGSCTQESSYEIIELP